MALLQTVTPCTHHPQDPWAANPPPPLHPKRKTKLATCRHPFENSTSLAKRPAQQSAAKGPGSAPPGRGGGAHRLRDGRPANSPAGTDPHQGRERTGAAPIGAGNRSLGQAIRLPQWVVSCPDEQPLPTQALRCGATVEGPLSSQVLRCDAAGGSTRPRGSRASTSATNACPGFGCAVSPGSIRCTESGTCAVC